MFPLNYSLEDLAAAQGLYGKPAATGGIAGRVVNPWGTAQTQFQLPDNSNIIHIAQPAQMPWANTSNFIQPQQSQLGQDMKNQIFDQANKNLIGKLGLDKASGAEKGSGLQGVIAKVMSKLL